MPVPLASNGRGKRVPKLLHFKSRRHDVPSSAIPGVELLRVGSVRVMGQLALRRVLVVDDEFLIAMDIETMLEDMGMQVVGPATTLKAALELAETETIDCAILDVDLGDGNFVTSSRQHSHFTQNTFRVSDRLSLLE